MYPETRCATTPAWERYSQRLTAVEQRGALCPRDSAIVDQLERGLVDMWTESGLDPHLSARAALIALQAFDDRLTSLEVNGIINEQTALAGEHCLQELRMAMCAVA